MAITNDPEMTINLTLHAGDWLSLYFAAQRRVEDSIEEIQMFRSQGRDEDVKELSGDLLEYQRMVGRLGNAITEAEVPDRDLYGLP